MRALVAAERTACSRRPLFSLPAQRHSSLARRWANRRLGGGNSRTMRRRRRRARQTRHFLEVWSRVVARIPVAQQVSRESPHADRYRTSPTREAGYACDFLDPWPTGASKKPLMRANVEVRWRWPAARGRFGALSDLTSENKDASRPCFVSRDLISPEAPYARQTSKSDGGGLQHVGRFGALSDLTSENKTRGPACFVSRT